MYRKSDERALKVDFARGIIAMLISTLLSLGHSIASMICIVIGTSGWSQAPLMVVDHAPLVVCAGMPVWVDVETFNLSQERRVYFNNGGALPTKMWRGDGKRVAIHKKFKYMETGDLRGMQFNSAADIDIEAGGRRTQRLNLAEYYPLEKPGLYWFTVGHPVRRSGAFWPAAWPLPRPLLVVSCTTDQLNR